MMAVSFPSRNNMSLADRQALRRAELAQELMRSATAIEPIQTHTQGLAKLAQALVGGMIEQKAQKEAAAKEAEKRRQAMALLKGLGAAVPDEPAPQPQPEPPGFFGRLFGWGQDQPTAVQPAAGMSPPIPQGGQMPAALPPGGVPPSTMPPVPQAADQMLAGAAAQGAQPSPVSGSSVLRDPAFLAYLSSLETPEDIMSVVLPLTLNEREREDRRQEKEEDRAFRRQEREEERAYREAMRRADQEYRAQQLALERQRLALSARETFGAPQVVMRDGQPVYVQVGSQGTIRELPGYTPEQQGLFGGNSLEGQRINYLLNNQDKVNTPEYATVFIEQYGPKPIVDPQGNVLGERFPLVPPGVAIPDELKHLYGQPSVPLQPEPMQTDPTAGLGVPPPSSVPAPSEPMPSAPADQYQPTPAPAPAATAQPPAANVMQLPSGARVTTYQKPDRQFTPQEMDLLKTADENIARTNSTINKVRKAIELNKTAFDGPIASYLGDAAAITKIDEETANATKQLDSIFKELAIDKVKLLGTNPTDRDMQIVEEAVGSVNLKRGQRETLLNSLLATTIDARDRHIQQREAIIRGEYGRTNPNYTTPPQSRAPEPPASQPQSPPQSRASEPPPDFIVVDPKNPRRLRQYAPHEPLPDPRTTVGGMIVP
jgi:hypothetical protein